MDSFCHHLLLPRFKCSQGTARCSGTGKPLSGAAKSPWRGSDTWHLGDWPREMGLLLQLYTKLQQCFATTRMLLFYLCGVCYEAASMASFLQGIFYGKLMGFSFPIARGPVQVPLNQDLETKLLKQKPRIGDGLHRFW